MKMFKKVFKYDFAYVKRFWWIITASVLGISFFGSLVYRFVAVFDTTRASAQEMFLYVSGEIFLVACFIAVPVSFIAPQILCYVRFYKNFFTDEGYLTFTLPVSRRTLFLSKVVNTVLWTVIHAALMLAAIAIVITIAPVPNKGQLLDLHVWEAIGRFFSRCWEGIGGWLIVYIFEGILLAVAAAWFTCSLISTCVTIGAVVAKKHKVLAAFGVYYGINMASSFLMQLAAGLGVIFVVVPVTDLLVMGDFSVNTICLVISLMLLILLLMEAAVACLFHFLALGKLERKLNLS